MPPLSHRLRALVATASVAVSLIALPPSATAAKGVAAWQAELCNADLRSAHNAHYAGGDVTSSAMSLIAHTRTPLASLRDSDAALAVDNYAIHMGESGYRCDLATLVAPTTADLKTLTTRVTATATQTEETWLSTGAHHAPRTSRQQSASAAQIGADDAGSSMTGAGVPARTLVLGAFAYRPVDEYTFTSDSAVLAGRKIRIATAPLTWTLDVQVSSSTYRTVAPSSVALKRAASTRSTAVEVAKARYATKLRVAKAWRTGGLAAAQKVKNANKRATRTRAVKVSYVKAAAHARAVRSSSIRAADAAFVKATAGTEVLASRRYVAKQAAASVTPTTDRSAPSWFTLSLGNPGDDWCQAGVIAPPGHKNPACVPL